MKKLTLIGYLFFSIIITNAQQGGFPELTGPYLGQKPPGLTPEIFAPGIVSTDYFNHSTVCISSDGSEIYWSMAPKDTPDKIYYTKRINNVWTRPEIISFTQA